MQRSWVLATLVLPGLISAATHIETGGIANEETCRIGRVGSRFRAADPQVVARVRTEVLGAADRLVITWIDPSGETVERAEYSEFVPGRSVCILNALPVAGFVAGDRPGQWRVEVRVHDRVLATHNFDIDSVEATASIDSVKVEPGSGGLAIEVAGRGFSAGSTVHIARFTAAGGWQYLASEIPTEASAERIRAVTAALPPGEYIAVIRGRDGAVSRPARLLVQAGDSYQFPAAARERWVITQRPYGAFSHWNRSRHAWDLAPVGDRRVVAMRSGIARTFDLGLKRTPWKRSFGNYITIDHGDGEFSHYAHLESGTFLVRNGERVERGQPLARAGNSGYALGPGGGVHLHVHVTRAPSVSAQSIPFQFGDSRPATPALAEPRKVPLKAASVGAGLWWSELIPVPRRSPQLRVWVEWDDEAADVDLHLVSPTGRHYGWYGESRGYTGARSRPEEFRIAHPEPGRWRISVQGIGGGPGAISFRVGSQTE
jgi:murein DD-endopeptidase MepM/ murein hydrolase activator NlpD